MPQLNPSQVLFPRLNTPGLPCSDSDSLPVAWLGSVPWVSRAGRGLPWLTAGMPRLFFAYSGSCVAALPAVAWRLCFGILCGSCLAELLGTSHFSGVPKNTQQEQNHPDHL